MGDPRNEQPDKGDEVADGREMIDISADKGGLRQACLEMLEEEFEAVRRGGNRPFAEWPTLHEGPPLAELIRSLPLGYYVWTSYVARIVEEYRLNGRSYEECRSSLAPEELVAAEALGEATAEFKRKHPPCGSCGLPLRKAADEICDDCKATAAVAEGMLN